MSTNTELQALLSKMGGTPTESDTNSDLIKKINEVYAAGGSGGEASGGVLMVHEQPDPVTLVREGVELSVYMLDKTAEEINTAVLSGKNVLHVAEDDDNVLMFRQLLGHIETIYRFSSFGPGSVYDDYVYVPEISDYPFITSENPLEGDPSHSDIS